MKKPTAETEIPLNMGRIEEGANENQDDTETMPVENNRRKTRKLIKSTKWFKISIIIFLILLAVVLIAYFTYFYLTKGPTESISNGLTPPNPVVPLPPSASPLEMFKNGAVCSDSKECSQIGRDIFNRGGNIIDSAIATLFCNGIMTMQSLGIGGGFIMNFYNRTERRAYTLNARDIAPLSSTADMFVDKPKGYSMEGPQSIAVPGEVMGYWEAFRRFSSMPWRELIQPSIKICEEGFQMSQHMYNSLHMNPRIKNDFHLRNTFINNKTGEFFRVGEHIKPPKELCDTYRQLSTDNNGGLIFYNGELARLIVEDLQEIGSNITINDLRGYEVKWNNSIKIDLDENNDLYVVPPTGSGILVGIILNILEGYHISREDLLNKNDTIIFYHRFIEACKHAFAKRTELGDMNYNDLRELINNLTSKEYAHSVRQRINDEKTFDDVNYYGAKFWSEMDQGTSHVSIISPTGDAVSITSSVNFYFGSGHSGRRTGIIFNSGMDDFSTPGKENYFGLPSSKPNFIQAKKRAMSSMSPTIVTDTDGDVKLVLGAAGGSKIISAVAWTIARIIWFDENIKEAIDSPRLHHQLLPNHVEYEYGILQDIVDGLEAKGHKLQRYRNRTSVICGIAKNKTAIYANADYRKKGGVSGLSI